MRFYSVEEIGPNRTMTPEGFMVCIDVPLARTGLQIYAEGEVPKDLRPDGDGFIRVERDPEEVFRPATIASANGKPVVNEHPVENDDGVNVTPENFKKFLVGAVLNPHQGERLQDDLLLGDLIIYDPEAIKLINEGKRQLSLGYDSEYEELEVGRARQYDIVINHCALVEAGRCGPRCEIRDHKVEIKPTYDFKQLIMPRKKKILHVHLY